MASKQLLIPRQARKDNGGPIRFLIKRIVPPFTDCQELSLFETSSVSSPSSATTVFDYLESEDNLPDLEHEDYKYLYYMIICKLQELYRDLQVRYACNFINMDHVLHTRADTGLRTKDNENFTVRDMRNFILAAWHLYHDQTFLFVLNNAIKNRKLSVLSGLQLNVLCDSRQDKDKWSETMELNILPESLGNIEISYKSNSLKDSALFQGSETKYAALRNTIKGVEDTTNSSILMDLFNKKYSMGPYKHDTTGSKPKLDDKIGSSNHEFHLDDVFIDNDERKPNLEQVVEQAKFNRFGQILSPLECECKPICDCKFICDLHPNVCICVYRQQALGSSPDRLCPEHPTIRLQSPTKNRRSRVDMVPKPLFSIAIKNTDQVGKYHYPDNLNLSSTTYMHPEDIDSLSFPLPTRLPSFAMATAPLSSPVHTESVTLQQSQFECDSVKLDPSKAVFQPEMSYSTPRNSRIGATAPSKRIIGGRDTPPTPPTKPLPRLPKIAFETADIYVSSPLSSLGNYMGVMNSLRKKNTKVQGLERNATEPDLSYRIPFENNKYFMSSPQLLARCRARYVSTSGNIPLSECEQVTDPFFYAFANISMPKETLLNKLASASTSNVAKHSSPESQLVDMLRQNTVSKARDKKSRFSGLLKLRHNQSTKA